MPDAASSAASGTTGLHGWRRFDTLFVRLFLLLWVTLVASSLLGFEAFRATNDGASGLPAGAGPAGVMLVPSLPPLRAFAGGDDARRSGRPNDGASGSRNDSDRGRADGQPPPPRDAAEPPPPGRVPPGGEDRLPPERESTPPPRPDGDVSQDAGSPANPRGPQAPAAPGFDGGRGRPSTTSLWVDMAVRILVIGLTAAWAARWLSAPVRDLGNAARRVRDALQPARGHALAQEPPQVDARRGSAEIRATAQVFNDMARQLKADFDAQRLLLATVSHDLRTPLTRLRLRLASIDGAPAGAAADIEEMNGLLEGLLDLFRQPTTAGSRGEARIDVASLVQAVIDDLPGDTPPVEFVAAPAVATCGAMPLRRIVHNLLGNALKHGADVSVGVKTECADDGRPQVVIDIDDRGPGLTPEQLAQVGTPFVRWDAPADTRPAHDEDLTRRAGLGLGLHIARALAEREGGELRLAAREGGGLHAQVRLPAVG